MALENNAAVLANVLKAKAKSDGEDVITSLVTQADTAILAKICENK